MKFHWAEFYILSIAESTHSLSIPSENLSALAISFFPFLSAPSIAWDSNQGHDFLLIFFYEMLIQLTSSSPSPLLPSRRELQCLKLLSGIEAPHASLSFIPTRRLFTRCQANNEDNTSFTDRILDYIEGNSLVCDTSVLLWIDTRQQICLNRMLRKQFIWMENNWISVLFKQWKMVETG